MIDVSLCCPGVGFTFLVEGAFPHRGLPLKKHSPGWLGAGKALAKINLHNPKNTQLGNGSG